MSQYEQENDFGRGGGEVDEETMRKAWETAAAGWSSANVDEEGNLTEEGAARAEDVAREQTRGDDAGGR